VERLILGGNLLLRGKSILPTNLIQILFNQQHEANEMLEMINIEVANAVAYRLEGKITEEEVKSVFSIFRKKIEKGEKLIVYQEIVSIGGVEFDAIVEKLKFLYDVGISHFDRIAEVTHKNWIQKIVDLEDKIFKSVDMKAFSVEEKDEAVEFLKGA
jgi:hypothetical protein